MAQDNATQATNAHQGPAQTQGQAVPQDRMRAKLRDWGTLSTVGAANRIKWSNPLPDAAPATVRAECETALDYLFDCVQARQSAESIAAQLTSWYGFPVTPAAVSSRVSDERAKVRAAQGAM